MNKDLPWIKENIVKLPLDESFVPASLWNKYYKKMVEESSTNTALNLAIIKDNNSIMVYKTQIFSEKSKFYQANYYYADKLIKTLLWIYGGYKIIVGGSRDIANYIIKRYCKNGSHYFDASFMSKIYEKPFKVEIADIEKMPSSKEKTIILGNFLKGYRIGFDLGASDRKVSAIIDGNTVFSEEVIWNPSAKSDPSYHYNEIMSMLHRAAAYMPRVDAIGGSSAGIYINNKVMAASIFRSIPEDTFNKKVKNIFSRIQKKWRVPLKVINDGEVSALAGSMALKKKSILGIAMGSSEAGGYVDENGKIGSRIDELAFVPIDYNPSAPIDEWSKDTGCGAQYFSQLAVIRLAQKVNIELDQNKSPAEKLEFIQKLMVKGDNRVKKIFKTIGSYLGYAIAYYSDFYAIKNVLVLGRVTSGKGGKILVEEAERTLKEEFPKLSSKINIFLPDEKSRRVGQAVAAASLIDLGN